MTIIRGGDSPANEDGKIDVAIVGLTHGHVKGWLRGLSRSEFRLVGIWEPNSEVVAKYAEAFDLDSDLFFTDLPKLLSERHPQAVWVFTNTREHENVTVVCAPRGVNVILEKPLATNFESAKRMAELARANGIQILTNYATTWYDSIGEVRRLAVDQQKIGRITKVVGQFGHNGPVEIGVPPEFGRWLIDPELNGGGAVMDFGCYGANIFTWLADNQRPLSVTAVFRQNKSEIYPLVEDDATILIEYPNFQGVVQASWDWPFSRKDIAVYGRSGELWTDGQNRYALKLNAKKDAEFANAKELDGALDSASDYFAAVLRGELDPSGSLSSLENNLIVMEILDAAKVSSRTGSRVSLRRKSP